MLKSIEILEMCVKLSLVKFFFFSITLSLLPFCMVNQDKESCIYKDFLCFSSLTMHLDVLAASVSV